MSGLAPSDFTISAFSRRAYASAISGSICDFARFISFPTTGLCALSSVGMTFISAVNSPFGPVMEADISATYVFVFAAGRADFAFSNISLILFSISVKKNSLVCNAHPADLLFARSQLNWFSQVF